MLSVSPDPFFRFAGNLDLKRMVNVYMRRKKLVKFYLRRRRGFNDGNQRPSTALFSTEISAEKEQVLNTGPFYIVNDFLNTGFVGETPATCTLEKNLDNSEVKFESHASVMSSKPGDDIVLNTPRNLPENVPNNAQIPSGSKKINNENLVSVLQQLTSTYSLQRRPRSARKAASSASRRWVTIECAASDTSKSIASPGALSSTSVYCGIIPKTPIKEDKKSKFIAKRICLDVPSLLSTGLLEGAFVKYKKDNLELQGSLTTSGIRCGCSLCNFKKVVTSLNFEKHAGSKSYNQNDHIFFENGKSLYGLSKELKNVSLGSLGEVIEEKIGYRANADYNAWKVNPEMDNTKGVGKNQNHFSDLFHVVQESLKSRLPTSEDNLSLPSRNVPEIDFPGQAGQTMGHRFPKGPRSARGKKPSPSVISKANQNPSRQLPFYDHDPLHPPAHKKMGLDMIPSKESVTLMVSSALTSSNSYQAKVGDSLLQNPENIRSPAPIGENEVNMSDIYTPDTPLSSVNHLLATGLLEGLSVNYKKDEIELCGLIKDLGILCGCSSCHFRKVLSLLSFEKHGGSSSKDRNKYIFVNDKITLRALVEELWGVPLGLLSHEVIEKMVGCKPNMNCFMAWKGSFDKLESSRQQTSTVDGKNKLTDVWMHHKRSSDERSRLPTSEDNLSLPSRNVPEIDFPGQAGQTMRHRDQDFHQYIFDLLNDGSKLSYRSHGEEVLTGYKIGKNILCNCCNVPVTPSKFEAHAGHGTRRKPYHSIYTSYGKSLHQIAMFLLHENSVEHSNKDHIMISKAGRDLPLHAYNAGEPCPSVCGSFSFYMGRKFLVPCTSGSCMICRDGDATLNFGNICDSTMLFCGQCSRKFHVGCLRHHGICDIERRPCPPDIWLCGNNCRKVRADLLDFIQSGPKTVPESLLSSLKSCSAESTSREETEVDVHWQLLSGTFQGDESKSLLEQATEIFQGAFYAVYKGHRDVLSTMVKGERGVAEFFGGMLCAVITVKSIIVSAALLRVFGNHVAELPLAVTSKERQEEGYFKILFLKIEEMLSFIKVENLILPADDDSLSMWVEKFGFTKLNKNEIMEYRMKHNIVMFEKTTMLKKAIASTIH